MDDATCRHCGAIAPLASLDGGLCEACENFESHLFDDGDNGRCQACGRPPDTEEHRLMAEAIATEVTGVCPVCTFDFGSLGLDECTVCKAAKRLLGFDS